MYTPVNPSFTIQKWGLRGSKLYRYVFVMPLHIFFDIAYEGKVIKTNLMIVSKSLAYLLNMTKTIVQYQKDRCKTVEKVTDTRYIMSEVRNYAPRTMDHENISI